MSAARPTAVRRVRARPPSAAPGRRRGRGFALVEVLVAMFVAALGILALAALLQAATRHSKIGELRATATLLADDIADRIRANAVGAALGAGGYDLTDPAFPSPLAPLRAACTRAAPCGPADRARVDLADWTARVRASLPRGSAWIEFHAGPSPAPATVDVWVAWADPLAPSAGGAADRAGTECPAAWRGIGAPVRCVYLPVAP